MFNGLVDINTRNAAVLTANTNFQEHAEGVVASGSALRSAYTSLSGLGSPIAIQQNYLDAYAAFNTFMAGSDNSNRTEAVRLGARLKTAIDALTGGAEAAQNQANNLIAASNNVSTAQAHSQNAVNNLVTLRNDEANAHTALNMYRASANAFRDLTIYTGYINSTDGSVITPGIAAYDNAAATNNAVFATGGFVGSYGGANYGENITNGIRGAVVAAAKENNTMVATVSHTFEEHLHNISRARFASSDTANNAFKTALNSLETASNFAARTSTLSQAEAALNTALVAYAANRNNATLQAGVSNAAKVLAGTANASITECESSNRVPPETASSRAGPSLNCTGPQPAAHRTRESEIANAIANRSGGYRPVRMAPPGHAFEHRAGPARDLVSRRSEKPPIAGGTASGRRRLHVDFHRQLRFPTALIHAACWGRIGVVAPDGYPYVPTADRAVVGRIKTRPAPVGKQALDPGVHGHLPDWRARAVGDVEITRYVPRRHAPTAGQRNHQVGEILADPAAGFEHVLDRGTGSGATGSKFELPVDGGRQCGEIGQRAGDRAGEPASVRESGQRRRGSSEGAFTDKVPVCRVRGQ